MVSRFLFIFYMVVPLLCTAQTASIESKNQVGLNASKFLLIFNEQVETFDVTYRRQISSDYFMRLGSNIGYSDDRSGIVNLGLQLGFDKNFRKYEHWSFYTGVDISYAYSKINSNDSESFRCGLIPHLGIQYFIGKHFSISTEPSLGLFRTTIDDKGFNPQSDKTWNEVKFLKLGEIIFSFIF